MNRNSVPGMASIREDAVGLAHGLGYTVSEEDGRVFIGSGDAGVLVTACENEPSGAYLLMQILRSMSRLHRERAAFLLYPGKLPEFHGEPLLIRLDRVGYGDELILTPGTGVSREMLETLRRCTGWFGIKHITLTEAKGEGNTLRVHAMPRKKGLKKLLPNFRRHSGELDETNINILRACIATLISGS